MGGGVIASIALGYLAPLGWPGTDDLAARTIGLTIGAAGVALLVWAIMTLRRHGTTVLPDVGATALVTDGPYWRYRNPIYLADAMILLGIAELTKNIWFVVAAAAFAGARHLARHPPRGATPRTALRQGLCRLQGEVAPVDLRIR